MLRRYSRFPKFVCGAIRPMLSCSLLAAAPLLRLPPPLVSRRPWQDLVSRINRVKTVRRSSEMGPLGGVRIRFRLLVVLLCWQLAVFKVAIGVCFRIVVGMGVGVGVGPSVPRFSLTRLGIMARGLLDPEVRWDPVLSAPVVSSASGRDASVWDVLLFGLWMDSVFLNRLGPLSGRFSLCSLPQAVDGLVLTAAHC
uniref:EG:196F3.1 protein n=1 Tax=Drosophila melanogaster TaxID=7227 RepID=O76887_DROME|nr:EG:196F3.1 [Drosophila melanogaster]